MHGTQVGTKQCAKLLPAPGCHHGASAHPSRGCHLKCRSSDTSTEVAQATATLQMGFAAALGRSQGAEQRLLLPSPAGTAVASQALPLSHTNSSLAALISHQQLIGCLLVSVTPLCPHPAWPDGRQHSCQKTATPPMLGQRSQRLCLHSQQPLLHALPHAIPETLSGAHITAVADTLTSSARRQPDHARVAQYCHHGRCTRGSHGCHVGWHQCCLQGRAGQTQLGWVPFMSGLPSPQAARKAHAIMWAGFSTAQDRTDLSARISRACVASVVLAANRADLRQRRPEGRKQGCLLQTNPAGKHMPAARTASGKPSAERGWLRGPAKRYQKE